MLHKKILWTVLAQLWIVGTVGTRRFYSVSLLWKYTFSATLDFSTFLRLSLENLWGFRDIENIHISHKVDFMIYLLMQGRWCVSALCIMPSSHLYVQVTTTDIFMENLFWKMVNLSLQTTWPSFPYWNNTCNEFVVPNSSDNNKLVCLSSTHHSCEHIIYLCSLLQKCSLKSVK